MATSSKENDNGLYKTRETSLESPLDADSSSRSTLSAYRRRRRHAQEAWPNLRARAAKTSLTSVAVLMLKHAALYTLFEILSSSFVFVPLLWSKNSKKNTALTTLEGERSGR